MSHLNQTARFSNVSDLVMYVCEQPRPLANDYDPVCPFPYVNRGWLGSLANDSDAGSEIVLKPSDNYDTSLFSTNVVFNDCSQTMAEVLGTRYTVKCVVYCLLSLIPTLLSCFFLKVMFESKKAKNKGKAKKAALVRRAEERSDELLFFFVIISSSLISVVDSLRSLYRICRKRCAF
jgi:hypothetical protein